jgi:DNA polymerase-3 subunit gamma/tau
VKFIFATTEIRKVPVTMLSRCQRFDLKRVDREVLANHLARHLRQRRRASSTEDGLAADRARRRRLGA